MQGRADTEEVYKTADFCGGIYLFIYAVFLIHVLFTE